MSAIPVDRLNAALEGRYVVESELGEGGMATVYLADDLKHERKVALKVLKPELAAVVGAERFLAEIKTTANLQHPHILPLFDSGEADSFLFYVMPYVEGETLQERINREKQLPVDEALGIATAIANALQTAHDAGIVHRDIKPANILLSRGEPLVADFGIALAVGAAGGNRLTETGLSVGTPFYMSPEQATGDQVVGPASDTYALACVLYEMLVGEPPYIGNTAQAVLGKIIQGLPVSATSVRKSIPANVDAALRKGLEKLPADRFTDAQEFARALADPGFTHGEVAGVGAGGAASRRMRLGTQVFAATTLAFALLSMWALSRPAPKVQTHRASVLLSEPLEGFGTMALSRDGSVMVYEGPRGDGENLLWVRRWDALASSPLAGTNNGVSPSISPDGRDVVFVIPQPPPRPLVIVPLAGGVPRILTETALVGPHWGSDGFVYFTDAETRGISRIPAQGGPTEVITRSPVESNEGIHLGARFVEEGEAVLFHVFTPGGPQIRAARIKTGQIVDLGQIGVEAHYVTNGYLVFLSTTGDFMAAPFDPKRLEVTGTPVPVVGGASYAVANAQSMALAENGTLVYSTGLANVNYQPTWVNRDGSATVIDPEWSFDPGNNNRGLSLSPDGTRLVVSILGDLREDVWIKQLPTGPLTRITADSAQDVRPRWTQDGRVTFVSDRAGTADIYATRADGTGRAELLLNHELALWEGVLSRDGEWLLARTGGVLGAVGGRDVIGLRPATDSLPGPLVTSEFDEKAIMLSPDARWLVYESDETGRNEIYVRPFPNVESGKWPVSVDGGVMPLWAHSGTEIFYVNGRNEMVSAQIRIADSTFEVTEREALFTIDSAYLIGQAEQYTLYDVSPDDQRFVMLRRSDTEAAELILVQNWLGEIERRVGN